MLQQHALYLGEINDSQALVWRKSIEVFDEHAQMHRTLTLFSDDRLTAEESDATTVRLRLMQLRLLRPHMKLSTKKYIQLKIYTTLAIKPTLFSYLS